MSWSWKHVDDKQDWIKSAVIFVITLVVLTILNVTDWFGLIT